jgi:hypothetical protein
MKTILIIFFLFLSFNTFGETTKRDLTKHDNFIYWKNEAYSVDSVEKELRLKCGIQWFKVSFNRNEFDGSLASGKVVELNEKTMKINRGQGDKEIVEIFRFDNYYDKNWKDTYTFYLVAYNYQYYKCIKDPLYYKKKE